MNLEANDVIEAYKEKVAELTNEVIILKAMLKAKEKEVAAKEGNE